MARVLAIAGAAILFKCRTLIFDRRAGNLVVQWIAPLPYRAEVVQVSKASYGGSSRSDRYEVRLVGAGTKALDLGASGIWECAVSIAPDHTAVGGSNLT